MTPRGPIFYNGEKTAEYEAKACKPGKEITLEDIYNSKELEGFCEYCKEELIKAEKKKYEDEIRRIFV